MFVHTADKSHKCPECGKTFGQLGNMKSHMLAHSDDKPFECAKRFKYRANMIRHILVHSGSKPH